MSGDKLKLCLQSKSLANRHAMSLVLLILLLLRRATHWWRRHLLILRHLLLSVLHLLELGQHLHHLKLLLGLLLFLPFLAPTSLETLLILNLVDLVSVKRVSSLVSRTIMSPAANAHLCSFISFHSLKAPLIPSAAIPTAAASCTQAFVCFFRASSGDISPSATNLCLFSWASILE